jgi:hypothetical protein
MKQMIIIILFMFSSYGGCQSPRTTQKEGKQTDIQQEAVRDTIEPVVMQKPPMPTAIKPNLTLIGAVVDSVVVTDSINYKIFFYVNTAIPEGGLESIAEANQRISAVASYVVGEDGRIDMNHERNKRLFRLREAVEGDVFIGKISLTDKHGWVIVDVESFK